MVDNYLRASLHYIADFTDYTKGIMVYARTNGTSVITRGLKRSFKKSSISSWSEDS